MKKGKLLLIACVAMVIACIFVVSIFAVGNETSTPSLTIASNTLELKNAVFMNFKVLAKNVDDTSSVKLLVWENAPSEYTKDSAQLTLSSIRTESDTGYIVFQYDDLAAKDMTKVIYVCAYIELDGNAIYSKPVKFSIIQYAHTILTSSSSSEELKELVSNMLYYGATAQTYFEHNTDFLATDSVAKIKVVNGTHADGFKTGYYKTGTSVTLTANAAEDGYVFSYWQDSEGNIVGTENKLTISECSNETYTAVYNTTVLTSVQYRYRTKQYTTSTTELEYPWVLYDTQTTSTHSNYKELYIHEDEYYTNWELKNSEKYCIHGGVTKKYLYIREDGRKTVYLSYLDNPVYIDNYKYLYSDTYYCYKYCTSQTQTHTYKYYQWSEWSEWSDTPIVATDDMEVETRGIFTVVYDANGGVNAPQMQSKEIGENIIISSNIPTREGHTFKGWSSTIDGAVEYNPGDLYCDDNSITLYAIWGVNTYTIVYNANGGTNAPQMQTKIYGTDQTLSNIIPTREGYAFKGWSSTSSGLVEYTAGDIYSDDNNITLYAVWELVQTSEMLTSGECGENLKWELFEDGTLIISGTGDMFDYSVPATSSTKSPPWNGYRSVITDIIIGDSVTRIGNSAFVSCENLNSVYIGVSVLNIGEYSFRSCKSLEYISIPESVIQIRKYAFDKCNNLVSVDFSSNITFIGEGAFQECTKLNNVVLPSSLKTLERSAFYYCTGLTDITIPSTLKEVGDGAFSNCTKLTNVYIDDIVKWCEIDFYSAGSNPLYRADNLFLNNELVTNLVIPKGVNRISNYAFYQYKNLVNITIPDTVTTIGLYAFSWCENLVNVTFENTSGWIVDGKNIIGLSDANTAANYLTSTYSYSTWIRE